jgi:hypothetical protein
MLNFNVHHQVATTLGSDMEEEEEVVISSRIQQTSYGFESNLD